jgi:6-phosphogluconolactonase
MTVKWRTEADAAAVADTACRLIDIAARKSIAKRSRFRLVLAGGSTPLSVYRQLAVSDQKWKHWSLYYGDERCLPADHPDRNSQLVAATGLPARAGKHYPISAERGGTAAAADYRARIRSAQPFDMVLLGMGEDGHTASLFPGQTWPDKSVFAVTNAPKPPPDRVTLGVHALQNCRCMLVLVTGDSKAFAVQQWRSGADLPIARVSDVDHGLIVVERKCLGFAVGQAGKNPERIESVR